MTNLRYRQVSFLDEIHRLQPVLEEKLYTALEDYKLDTTIGQGPAVNDADGNQAVHVHCRHNAPGAAFFAPRSRFGILLRLEFYTEDELRYIVERSAEVLNVPDIHWYGAAEIALRSAGEHRASPTGSCGGFVTMPRCEALAALIAQLQKWPEL